MEQNGQGPFEVKRECTLATMGRTRGLAVEGLANGAVSTVCVRGARPGIP